MARVAFLHERETDITGFNVAVSGLEDAYYYDVPAEDWQSADSVTVIYIGLQPPEEDEEITYPYTVKFHIQPHNDEGVLDEFIREITVEDPEDPAKKPLWDEDMVWEWLYTASWNYEHTGVRQVQAPDFNTYIEDDDLDYYYSGCCADGIFFQVGDRMGAYGYCDSDNQYYHSIPVNTPPSTIGYMYLFMFQSGNFIHYSSSVTRNFIPDKSICAIADLYSADATDYTKTGTYAHTQDSPKTGTIEFDIQVSDPPFGPLPALGSSEILYTDHLLVIITGLETKSDIFYLRHGYEPVFDTEQFRKDYWQYD